MLPRQLPIKRLSYLSLPPRAAPAAPLIRSAVPELGWWNTPDEVNSGSEHGVNPTDIKKEKIGNELDGYADGQDFPTRVNKSNAALIEANNDQLDFVRIKREEWNDLVNLVNVTSAGLIAAQEELRELKMTIAKKSVEDSKLAREESGSSDYLAITRKNDARKKRKINDN